MSELYKESEEKPYIDAFDYIEYLGEKIEDRKLIKINRFLQEDRKKKDREIERLNNIIDKVKTYCEDVMIEHKNGEYNVDTTWLAIEEHKNNIKSILNILNGDLKNYWRSDKEWVKKWK